MPATSAVYIYSGYYKCTNYKTIFISCLLLFYFYILDIIYYDCFRCHYLFIFISRIETFMLSNKSEKKLQPIFVETRWLKSSNKIWSINFLILEINHFQYSGPGSVYPETRCVFILKTLLWVLLVKLTVSSKDLSLFWSQKTKFKFTWKLKERKDLMRVFGVRKILF